MKARMVAPFLRSDVDRTVAPIPTPLGRRRPVVFFSHASYPLTSAPDASGGVRAGTCTAWHCADSPQRPMPRHCERSTPRGWSALRGRLRACHRPGRKTPIPETPCGRLVPHLRRSGRRSPTRSEYGLRSCSSSPRPHPGPDGAEGDGGIAGVLGRGNRPHRPPRFDVSPRLVSGLGGFFGCSAFPGYHGPVVSCGIPHPYRCGGSAGIAPASQFSALTSGTSEFDLVRRRPTSQAKFRRGW